MLLPPNALVMSGFARSQPRSSAGIVFPSIAVEILSTPRARSADLLPEPVHKDASPFLDRGRCIQRKVLAIATRDQLHADRLAVMQRHRHHCAGQPEHVDRGDETDIVPE